MQCHWSLGSQIQLVGVDDPERREGGEGATWTQLSVPISQGHRRVIHDTVPKFEALRQMELSPAAGQGAFREAVLSYSREIRSVLVADYVPGPPDVDDPEAYAQLQQHAVWHLIELLLADPDAEEGYLVEGLVGWYQENCMVLSGSGREVGDSLVSRYQILAQMAHPQRHEDYWVCLQELIAVGQLKLARDLLVSHEEYRQQGTPQHELLDKVYTMLLSLPHLKRCASEEGEIVVEDPLNFVQQRKRWLRRVQQFPQEEAVLVRSCMMKDPDIVKGVRGILSILLGDPTYLRALSSSWLDLLLAMMLYKFTDLQRQHIRALIEQCILAKPHHDIVGSSDVGDLLEDVKEIMEAALDYDLQRVVQLCSVLPFTNIWFMAHIFDVLRASRGAQAVLDKPIQNFGGTQVEFYVLHFAESLMSNRDTWQIAAQYLAYCPVHGRRVMVAMLEKLQLWSWGRSELDKALILCERHGLQSTLQHLCRDYGTTAWHQGHAALALHCYLKAGHMPGVVKVLAPLMDDVRRELLRNRTLTRCVPLDVPQLEEVEPLVMMAGGDQESSNKPIEGEAPVLRFLRGLLQLQRAVEELSSEEGVRRRGDVKEQVLSIVYQSFSSALVDLVVKEQAPRDLWCPLICWVAPLLEGHQLMMSSAELQALAVRVAEVTVSNKVGDSLAASASCRVAALAVVRAMARTHQMENLSPGEPLI